jgi:hypothetical protein
MYSSLVTVVFGCSWMLGVMYFCDTNASLLGGVPTSHDINISSAFPNYSYQVTPIP